jgi:nucleoside phosphorylase
MASAATPRDRHGFEIALICALPLEAECVQEVFDKFWEDEGKRYGKAANDPNAYTTGVIGEHNVVLAYMPSMGTASAAAAAGSMRVSFPNIKLALVVGICGGMPYGTDQEEIMLGDVIISQALIQYDFGRQYPEGFKKKTNIQETLGRPSPEIRAVQAMLGTNRYMQKMQNNIATFLKEIEKKLPYTKYPGRENDILYQSSYVHQHHASAACDECGKGGQICEVALETECKDLGCETVMHVTRKRLINTSITPPMVHLGIMGSGNTVMKSGQDRDRIAKADGIVAFEMEGAGVWDYFPSIVIKGVCDYADSHKRKGWQRYAAATAAASVKAFLVEWISEDRSTSPRHLVGLPYSGSLYFSGRTRELSEIRRLLTSSNSQHRVLLWGAAGAGKTELAIQYVRQYKNDFSAIFFINAKNETSVQEDILSIAKILNLPEALSSQPGRPERSVASPAVIGALKQWFAEHDGDWLLIMDNLEFSHQFELNEYLPIFSNTRGCLIVTSQNKNANAYGLPIEVGEMSVEAAQDLFIKRSGFVNLSASQRETCLDIVAHLGYFALAVEHAAAYLQSTGMPLQTYLQKLQENISDYLKQRPKGSLYKTTTHATLEITFQAIRDRHKRAAELLSFLAYIDNKAVLESYLLSPQVNSAFTNWQCHNSTEDFYEIKSILLSFSLIRSQEVSEGDAIISMHSPVHSTIRLLLNINSQWLFLVRSAAFITLITEKQPLDGKWFLHVQLVLKLSTQLFRQQDINLSSEALWIMLAAMIFRYCLFWQITGTVNELDGLCATTLQALDLYTSDNAKIKKAVVISVRFVTIQFLNGPDAGVSMMSDFLVENMTIRAARFIEEMRQNSNSDSLDTDFRPCTLGDVFRVLNPPFIANIFIEVLKTVALIECSRPGGQTLGITYLRLSQLPRNETWITQARRLMGMGTLLTKRCLESAQVDLVSCAVIAARDRELGNMDSTILIFQNIIKTTKPLQMGWAGRFEGAVFDLAKVFLKMNRLEEARTTVQRLEQPNSERTELLIARSYKDFYVWARKIEARLITSHDDHHKAEAILQRTYETACKVFGEGSLSSLHAAFLLEQFYRQICCLSPIKADRFCELYTEGFAKMYCSQLRMRLGEGLFMGKILLAQGALEEAVMTFQHFAIGAEKLWGPDNAMAKRARKWEAHTARERSVEVRDEMEGRATLAWGCNTFPRNINVLGVED